jgi:hypothetical protein
MSNKILQLHSNPFEINFDKVTLPAGTTRNDVIQRYKSAVDDLEYLDKHYKRYIGDTQAPLQLMTEDLFGSIQIGVCYNDRDQIDVSRLSKLVPKESQKLYKEVVNLVYGIADGKPKSDLTLRKFKSLLCYYLCIAGF